MDEGETNRQLLELVEQLKHENELLKLKVIELEARLAQYENAHTVIASRRLSFYFLLGALFSLVRAPCVGGIIALGMSPEQVDHFRNKHIVAIRLLTGITLLALASLIYR
jgi:cytochrome c biogenesis protein CcdA